MMMPRAIFGRSACINPADVIGHRMKKAIPPHGEQLREKSGDRRA